MTRDEVIADAWINLIGPEQFNTIKNILDEKGAVSGWKFSSLGYGNRAMYTEMGKKHYMWRPKSLEGLETNNGWNRVEDNLPEREGMYVTGYLEDRKFIEQYGAVDMASVHKLAALGKITHWCPEEPRKHPKF